MAPLTRRRRRPALFTEDAPGALSELSALEQAPAAAAAGAPAPRSATDPGVASRSAGEPAAHPAAEAGLKPKREVAAPAAATTPVHATVSVASTETFGAEADALAASIIGQLRHLPEGDRWAMVLAVRGRVLEAAPERVALALNALGACFEQEGRISKRRYEAWRAATPLPEEWPSSRFIETTFDSSWKRAMGAFGADAVLDVFASELSPSTAPFSAQEVIDNIREYAEVKERPLVFDAFREWARDRMGDPARRQRRYIRSAKRIVELFGSWVDGVTAAGFGERLLAERAGRPRPRRGARSAEEQAEMAALVARAFGELRERAEAGEPVPGGAGSGLTKARFDAWVTMEERRQREEGQTPWLPRANQVAAVFESWHAALFAAGLISAEELAARGSQRTVFRPDDELVDGMLEALPFGATDLSLTEYRRFRRQRGAVDGVWLASDATVRNRLGWEHAVALAVARRLERNATGGGGGARAGGGRPRRPVGVHRPAAPSRARTREGQRPHQADAGERAAARPVASEVGEVRS